MFPPDIQYCMDHEVWLSNISCDVYDYCGLYHQNFTEWFDGDYVPFGEKAKAMTNFLDRWRIDAPLQSKVFLSVNAIKGIYQNRHDYALELKDSGLKLSNRQCKKQFPAVIRTGNFRPDIIISQVAVRAKQDFGGLTKDDIKCLYLAEHERHEARHKELMQSVRKSINEEEYFELGEEQQKEIDSRNALSVKRASELLSAVIGKEETEVFLGKNHVSVTGQKYDYKISPNNMTTGHSGLDIKILQKDTDQRLANLCFYYEGINAVDQAMAFVLDINNGNEDVILEIGNAFAADKNVLNNPFYKEIPGDDLGCMMLTLSERGRYKNLDNYSNRMEKLTSFAIPVINKYIDETFSFGPNLEELETDYALRLR